MKGKLDELMGEFEVREEDLQFGELSELEQRRILERTLQKAGLSGGGQDPCNEKGEEEMRQEEWKVGVEERNHRKQIRRRFIALGAAAVLVVGAVGVSAATGLSDKLLTLLQPKNEKQAKLLSESGVVIGKAVEDQGTSVCVRESVGDKTSVYVVVDLTAPKGTVLDRDEYSFETVHFSPNGPGSFGMGYQVIPLADENPKDNRISFAIQAESSDGIQGRDMHLLLEGLRSYSIEKGEYERILPGSWAVDFKLDYKDISKTYSVKQTMDLYGGPADITEVSVSPLSFHVEMKGDKIREYDENPPMLPEPATDQEIEAYNKMYMIEAQVKLKDGSVLEVGSIGTNINGEKLSVTGSFDQMLEMEQIQSIAINGTAIPVK